MKSADFPRSDSYTVAFSASNALGRIGGPAIPALIAALRDQHVSNPWLRTCAADALKQIDASDTRSISRLVDASGDRDPLVRDAVTHALAHVGSRAVPALIAALRDGDPLVRSGAEDALGMIGAPAMPALSRSMKDKNPYIRRGAVDALAAYWVTASNRTPYGASQFIPPSSAVPALIAALKDRDAGVRLGAASALNVMGPSAGSAVPALIVLLNDSNAEVQRSAAYDLAEIGAASAPAVPALIAALKDKNFITPDSPRADVILRQNSAVVALVSIGAPAIPSLKAALKNADPDIRAGAAAALQQLADSKRR
jgi:HEAT repeat protein